MSIKKFNYNKQIILFIYFYYHKFIFIINKNVYIYQKNNFKKLKEFFFIQNYRIN